jgi:phage-related protein
MSTINSSHSAAHRQAQARAVKQPEVGSYERNVKMFGPTAATAIGVAQAATEAVGTTVTFSAKALSELASAGKGAVTSVGDAIGDVYSALGNVVSTVGDGVIAVEEGVTDVVKGAATAVKDSTHAVLEAVRDTADEVSSTVSAVSNTVGDVATAALTNNVTMAIPSALVFVGSLL